MPSVKSLAVMFAVAIAAIVLKPKIPFINTL